LLKEVQFGKDAAPPSSASGEKPSSRKTRISLGFNEQREAIQTDFSPPVARGGVISRIANAASTAVSSLICFPRRPTRNFENIREGVQDMPTGIAEVQAAHVTNHDSPVIRLQDGTVVSYHSRMTDEEKFSNTNFIRDAKSYFKSIEGYHSEMDKNNALFKNEKFREDAIEHVSKRCKHEVTALVSSADIAAYGENRRLNDDSDEEES